MAAGGGGGMRLNCHCTPELDRVASHKKGRPFDWRRSSTLVLVHNNFHCLAAPTHARCSSHTTYWYKAFRHIELGKKPAALPEIPPSLIL